MNASHPCRPRTYAMLRDAAMGSTTAAASAIVHLAQYATRENVVDILSVIHPHLKINPADCAIHIWPSPPELIIAVHCLEGIDEIQTSGFFKDVQKSDTVTGKQFRLAMKSLWPDVWRWIEAIIPVCVRDDNMLVGKLMGNDWEDMQMWRPQMLNILMQLTTVFMKQHDSFLPLMLSIDGFTERMVEAWLYVFQHNLESVLHVGSGMLYCLHSKLVQPRFTSCLEAYEPNQGIGLLVNYVKSVVRQNKIYESEAVESVIHILLVFNSRSIEGSTKLRRDLLQMDGLAAVIRVFARFARPSFAVSSSHTEVDYTVTTITICIQYFHTLIEHGSIMWVKNALDNGILRSVLCAQHFISNSLDAGSLDKSSLKEVKTLESTLHATLLLFRPYMLYPSVFRRISRAVKSMETLGLLEKYGVQKSRRKTIGAAWALLRSEVKDNEDFFSCGGEDYAHRLCASVSCPHKRSVTSFTLLRCSGCQQVYYCSRSCQIIDWKRKPEHLSHKVVCAQIIHDRRACIGLPVNDVDLFAASKIALTRTMMDQKDSVRRRIRKFNLSRSQSEEERLNDSAAYCFLVTVRLDCRQYPLKARVLSFLEVLSLYPEEEEQKEALLSGSLSCLPSGWVDAFKAAKEKDLTLVYTILPNSSLSRTVVVGPWNARTGTRERD
ncbi:hypothetical protein BT96DRAFT_1013443 [Gymnopus androsaceus JB14]|uniref:MYND-type domain-containing protein n=1 Tax=Gymnopus androsaceus JB14 TaxID=1447944 RepID=A0A6A4IF65_9AGAR|nr:hypothetical protein BT96DRAFT_1013443 [Gymnopus androsaceus JB14]